MPVSEQEFTSTPERYGVWMSRLLARRAAAAIKAGHISTSKVTGKVTAAPVVPAKRRVLPQGAQLDTTTVLPPLAPTVRSNAVARKPRACWLDGMLPTVAPSDLATLVAEQAADDDSSKPSVASRDEMRVGDTYDVAVHDVEFGYIGSEPTSRPRFAVYENTRAWYMANALPMTGDLAPMGYSGPETEEDEIAVQDEREALDILAALADPELAFSDSHHTGSVESEFAWLMEQVRTLRGSYSEMLRQAAYLVLDKQCRDSGGEHDSMPEIVTQVKEFAQLRSVERQAQALADRYNARRCVHALAERRGVPFKAEWDKVLARKGETGATWATILKGYVFLIGRLNMVALLHPEEGHITVECLYRMPQPVAISTPYRGEVEAA